MEKKTWKLITILLIVLFVFLAIATLYYWAGTNYWKGEYEECTENFMNCAENFGKCIDDFERCSNYFHKCSDILEKCCP